MGPVVADHGIKVDLDVSDAKETELAVARERAEALFGERKYFAAERWYKEVIRIHERDDRAWARLGVIAVTQKRYDAGTTALQKSIKINPNVASRYYNLALAYYLQEDREEAIKAIDRAIQLSPDRANYLELKVRIAALKGD